MCRWNLFQLDRRFTLQICLPFRKPIGHTLILYSECLLVLHIWCQHWFSLALGLKHNISCAKNYLVIISQIKIIGFKTFRFRHSKHWLFFIWWQIERLQSEMENPTEGNRETISNIQVSHPKIEVNGALGINNPYTNVY